MKLMSQDVLIAQYKVTNIHILACVLQVSLERDVLADRLKAMEQQQQAVAAFNQESSLAKAEQIKAEVIITQQLFIY